MRVVGTSPFEPDTKVEILLDEAPLRQEMWQFGGRIFQLSIILSLIAAALVYLSLQWLLVRPMRRITASMTAVPPGPRGRRRGSSCRAAGATRSARPRRSWRRCRRPCARRSAQRARLAALGTAVTKINHDLRNILATARLVTDGLDDQRRARGAPRRAAPHRRDRPRGRAVQPHARFFARGRAALRAEPLSAAPADRGDRRRRWLVSDDDLAIDARRAAESRGRGRPRPDLPRAAEPGAQRGRGRRASAAHHRQPRTTAASSIDIADDGPGLPPRARENLFRPFAGSARPGGSGLGLAIARELMRAAWRRSGAGRLDRRRHDLPHHPAGAQQAPAPRASTSRRPLDQSSASVSDLR